MRSTNLSRLCGALLLLAAFSASAFPTRPIDEGELHARAQDPPRPEVLLDAVGASELFRGRAAKMVILHAGPHWAGTEGHRGALWLVDFSREPLDPALVRTDAHTWIGDPSISPDGTRVVYHDGRHICVCRLEEGGGEAARIGAGYDPRWWIQPETGDEYIIYVSTRWENSANVRGDTYIRKVARGETRPVGERATLVRGYALRGGRSRDGRYMSTAQPGWIWAELRPNDTDDALVRIIENRGGGYCNVSVSQDPAHPERFLWLDGPHRRLFYDPVTNASIPPLAPYREFTYTEWSTHRNFMTASFYGAGIREFEPQRHVVGVYDWTRQRWTPAARGAATHHLWVEETEADVTVSPLGLAAGASDGPLSIGQQIPRDWPSRKDGLVYVWETAHVAPRTFNAAGEPIAAVGGHPTPRGHVRHTRSGAMRLEGGAYHTHGVSEQVLPILAHADGATLEAWVTAGATSVPAAAPIVALPGVYGLWQDADRFLYAVGRGGTRGAPVETGVARHVVMTYADDVVRVYTNGAFTSEFSAHPAPLSEPVGTPLVFGGVAEAGGTPPWRGRVEGVAIYARALDADEALANYRAYAARVSARRSVAASSATARLIATPDMPDPSQSAYKRAWSAFEYDVEQVHSGDVPSGRILVARYVWMDGEELPAAHAEPGDRHELLLEPYEANSQIHSERQFHLDDVDVDTPMFYDVGPLTED